jgi:hypothetical protein
VSCANCQATFAALESEEYKERARRLDEQEPGCRCQLVQVSKHSPGQVENTEVLVRILVAPQHMRRKTGRPRSAALTDAERGGLSVFREERATDAEIRKVAEDLVFSARARQGKGAGVFGVLKMECVKVRNFCRDTEKEPCYCVYDSALERLPSHAEAFQRIAGVEDAIREDRRNTLFELIKAGFVPVDEFRDGLLKDLAPGLGS